MYLRPLRHAAGFESATVGNDKIKIGPISGFPEWLPERRIVEQRLLDTVRRQFELFGFSPIETPAIERWEVLTSKGGIQKQIYPMGRPDEQGNFEFGLHFDLTVPLARFVASRQHELVFPFRRYQIQKVWRGERAQRGRFREFLQCDIDVVGRGSLDTINDAEMPCVMNAVFQAIDGFPDFRINVSNRKIIGGLALDCSMPAEQTEVALRIIDGNRGKLEKLTAGLAELACPSAFVEKLSSLITSELASPGAGAKAIEGSPAAQAGYAELQATISAARALGMPEGRLVFDPYIVRGLDYYTGTVYETFVVGKEEWGSVCSGGRYDNLAAYFTTQKFPGVGMSIGLSRLLDLLVENGLVKTASGTPSRVLVTALQREEHLEKYLTLGRRLREGGIPAEVWLEASPLREQLAYGSKKGIPFAVIAGTDEFSYDTVKVRDLTLRSEEVVKVDALVEYIRAKLA
jgi:histidyl-tRNA synthetase